MSACGADTIPNSFRRVTKVLAFCIMLRIARTTDHRIVDHLSTAGVDVLRSGARMVVLSIFVRGERRFDCAQLFNACFDLIDIDSGLEVVVGVQQLEFFENLLHQALNFMLLPWQHSPERLLIPIHPRVLIPRHHLFEDLPQRFRVDFARLEHGLDFLGRFRDVLLWSVFTRLVDELKPDRAYYVLDGLDECDEDSQHWLTRRLVSFSNNIAESNFKLVVVSRELSELRESEQMSLDFDHSDEVSSDVKSFVQAKSLNLTKRVTSQFKFREEVGNEFRKRIENTLLERSQGSFLWVGFAMIELMKEETITGVLVTLDDLPKGLYALYERMLRKIRPSQRDTSLDILGWVALARRPLSLQELASAVSCESTIDSLSTEDVVAERVITCGPLIRVTEQTTVTLVHESARDYLLIGNDINVAASKGLHVQQEEVHLRIAQACVDALSRSCPLSNHAEQHWPHHIRQSKTLATRLISDASSFFANDSLVRKRWWQGHWKFFEREYSYFGIPDMPQLHMACYFGIEPWVNKILEGHDHGARLRTRLTNRCNKRNNRNATPLQLAAAAGHENIVQLLIQRGATIEGKNYAGDSACSLAARHGQYAVLNVLLSNGVHPDANLGDFEELPGFPRRTPASRTEHFRHYGSTTMLHYASAAGHATTVRLLLDHGACIETKTEDHSPHTPLFEAVKQGHEAVVRLLLERKADANAIEDHSGNTPLHYASEQENAAMVKLLIQHGADVDAKDNDGETALHMAARQESEALVDIFLEHGADVNAKFNDGGTALYMAASKGSEALMEVFLKLGADVNARVGNGMATLHVAVSWGSVAAVKVLLQYGADVNIKDGYDRTALDYLNRLRGGRGHAFAMTLLLLEHGADYDEYIQDSVMLQAHQKGELEAVAQLLVARFRKGD